MSNTVESDVVWKQPGPGLWELDLSHFRGGTTPIVQSLARGSMIDGMRRIMKDMGTPVDTIEPAFVNGFCFTRLRPLIGADKPATKLPPKIVLKIVTRLHPELRRRARSAERMLRERPWREVIDAWEREGRDAVERENLALQDVDLDALSDADLIEHVNIVLRHCRTKWELHFWLHGYDLGPIGLLLLRCQEWGIEAAHVIPLLEGASPVTTAPVEALARIRAGVLESGRDPSSLADVRSTSAAVADDLATYIRYRGSVLFSRYDIDGTTLGERPELLLATIMSGQDRAQGGNDASTVAERTEAVRSQVPRGDRSEFDEQLGEARAAMNLRDDNGPTTAEWPLGLLRLVLLAVGERLVRRGMATVAAHALEVTPDELVPGLLAGSGPSAAELAGRAADRLRCSRLVPPPTLGTVEVAPPISVLPASMGRLVAIVQLVMQQLGMAGDRDALGAGLRGTGVGRQTYRGTARMAASPEEALDRVEPGDVLVVAFTTPAYNMVLPIAGAIVTAVGGPLSHAAVLARELGIPAVIGAPQALIEIADGDEIEVDPLLGEVRIVTPA